MVFGELTIMAFQNDGKEKDGSHKGAGRHDPPCVGAFARRCKSLYGQLNKYLIQHFSMYIRQSEVPALVSVGQSFVVESEQVE